MEEKDGGIILNAFAIFPLIYKNSSNKWIIEYQLKIPAYDVYDVL